MTTQTDFDEDPHAVHARTRIGTLLQDKWRLDSVLGVGGMAAVYAATHRNGKRVAVKMLHAEFSHDPEVQGRFLQEGYAANAIQHDGAVSVLDDDIAPDGSAFLVMEMLEGETVDRRWELSGQKLPEKDVLAVADQLLDVLVAAHQRCVVHRDIKPENLFVTRSGQLKVLDFGIAKVFQPAAGTKSKATQAGMVMGTPAFMAPEQALAHWDEVDGRTDLWAVGATMFTLLSGLYVHEASSSQELLVRSATAPARSLASVAPGTSAEVVSLIDRALEFDRSKRWPDAHAMQVAVRSALGWSAPAGGAPSGVRERATLASAQGPSSELQSHGPLVTASPTPAETRAETVFDTTRAAAPTASMLASERETRLTQVTKIRGSTSDLQQRYAAAKKRAADMMADRDAARAEQKSLEQWVSRQVGTRTAAVESARQTVRRHAVTIARRAVADRAAFGEDFDAAREGVTALERVAVAASRDVVVHEAALSAYDARSLWMGVVLMGLGALLAIAILAAPIVWRATRVVLPPIPTYVAPRR